MIAWAACGVVAGLLGGTTRIAFVWAVIAATLTFVATVATMWARDQGGALWLLAIPVGLVSAGLAATSAAGFGFAVGAMVRWKHECTWLDARPLAVYVALVAAVWGAFQVQPMVSQISEAAMIANFHRHESGFRQLARMGEEDRRFTRIAPNFTHPAVPRPSWDRNPEVEQISPERREEYRALFTSTGNEAGIGVGDQTVLFYYWTAGVVIGGAVKGYVYSPVPLSPVVDSLERIPPDIDTSRRLYRQFADGWYLFYESYD